MTVKRTALHQLLLQSTIRNLYDLLDSIMSIAGIEYDDPRRMVLKVCVREKMS